MRKLDKNISKNMLLIGYSKNPKEYRLINLSAEKVVTRRDAVFNKIDFRFFKRADEDVLISPELSIVSGDEMTKGESQLEALSQRSKRVIRRPYYYGYSESTDAATTAYADTVFYTYNVKEMTETETIEEAVSIVHMQKNENWRLV